MGALTALAKAAQAAKALKAAQEVVPAVERAANLSKFLEDSKVKETLYRGQRKAPKADKFVTTQGRAVPSFTTDPEVGNVYSRQLETGNYGPGSTSVPVYVQMTNPLDIRDLGEHVIMDEFINRLSHDLNVPYGSKTMGYYDLADMLEDLDKTVYRTNAQYDIDASSGLDRIRSFEELADAIREAGESKNVNKILEDLLPTTSIDAYSLADHPAIVDELRKHGYDAMIHKDVFDAGMPYYQGNLENIQEGFTSGNVIDAYRPFEQSKIKSAIGNRGTYDTTDPDITKATGGEVHMAGGGGLKALGALARTAKTIQPCSPICTGSGSPPCACNRCNTAPTNRVCCAPACAIIGATTRSPGARLKRALPAKAGTPKNPIPPRRSRLGQAPNFMRWSSACMTRALKSFSISSTTTVPRAMKQVQR